MTDYSPDRFYTQATDEKGHTSKVRLSFPPPIAADVARIIASRRIPEYKTPQHFGRDAYFHRLRWVQDNYDLDDVNLNKDLSVWSMSMIAVDLLEREEEGTRLVNSLIRLKHECGPDEQAQVKERMLLALDSDDLPSAAKARLRTYL